MEYLRKPGGAMKMAILGLPVQFGADRKLQT